MKIDLSLDSTGLGSAGCMYNLWMTIGEGYRATMNAAAVYGIATHRFVDVMFKTKGHYPTARKEAEGLFLSIPKSPNNKQPHLFDPKHLITTCYNLWTQQVEEEASFELLVIPQDCWWCKGKGVVEHKCKEGDGEYTNTVNCVHCNGTGKVEGPATEITFRILIYEDDYIRIFLCGTLDSLGKFRNGCFAIRDWKTTSMANHEKYLSFYELSRQLRIYTLAAKLQAQLEPDSILGKVGATNLGAFIDGIFIKPKANENEYHRGPVMQLSGKLDAFKRTLDEFCKKVSFHVKEQYFPKEGILNGSCQTPFGKCKFWNVCKSTPEVASVLLARDFKKQPYNPLDWGNGE